MNPSEEVRSSAPPADLSPDPQATYSRRSSGDDSEPPGLATNSFSPTDAAPLLDQVPDSIPTSSNRWSALVAPPEDFRLLSSLGEGGQGEVWEAEQTCLQRVVAVKMPLREAADVVGRPHGHARERQFLSEALTTAALEHPNIVPVYALERDSAGRPQLGMKRVRGESWKQLLQREAENFGDEFLARHLGILIAVANAVAFAHARGVIHRDLKPAQVMVGDFGEVTLMDWGLAVVIDSHAFTASDSISPELRTIALPTTAQNPAGTPAFMAPEQTSPRGDMLGTWTDVFLLGGILYYLLTGTPPYNSSDARMTFLLAKEGMVAPPRTRASHRNLPEELVVLCEEALRRDPRERMTSATEFRDRLERYLLGSGRKRQSMALAEDVERQLQSAASDYPELAKLESDLQQALGLWAENPKLSTCTQQVRSRYAKLAFERGDLGLARAQAMLLPDAVRREEMLTQIADAGLRRARLDQGKRIAQRTAVAMALLLCVVGYRYWLDSMEAFADLQEQATIAEAARSRAANARTSAEELAAYIIDDVRQRLEPIGQSEVVASLAQRALAYYDDLAPDERSTQSDSRKGVVWGHLGVASIRQGSLKDALTSVETGVSILRGCVGEEPATAVHWIRLAQLLQHRGLIERRLGKLEAAQASFEESQQVARQAVELAPSSRDAALMLVGAHNDIGSVLQVRGDSHAALVEFREALRIVSDLAEDRETLLQLCQCQMNIGTAQRTLDQQEEALGSFQGALAASERIVALDETDAAALSRQATIHGNIGNAFRRLRMNEQCLDHYCAKYHLLRKLTQRDPENTDWRRGLSVTHGQLAYVLEDKGDLRAAVTQYERNLELLETLTAIDPANIDWQIGLGRTQLELAGALRLVGRLADSAEKKHQCIASARRLIPLAGENADPQFLLADALDSLGELLRLEGRHTDALAFLGEARALRNKLAPLGKTPPRQRARIRGLLSEAESALADSKLDLARQLAIEASELVAPLLAGNSSELENQQCAAMVAYLQARLGESNDLAGRLDVVAESLAGQNLIRHLKVLAKGYQQLGRERELRAVMERILPLGCRDPEIVQIGRSLAMDVSPPVKEPDALNPCLRR